MKNLSAIILVLTIFLSGCQYFNGETSKTTDVKNADGTIIKTKNFNNDPSSPIEWKVSVKVDAQGKTIRHGESIRYSKTGKVYERINYVDNKMEGKRYTYHSTGNIWKEQNYKDGKLDGECKRYDRSGKLTAIYNYKQGLPGTGLIEYTNLGIERTQPTLKITKLDEVSKASRYKIKLSLTGEDLNSVKSVDYYLGDLIEGKYFHKNLERARILNDKEGEFNFEVPKGTMLKKTYNMVAVVKKSSGLLSILQSKVSVNVSN